MELTTVRLVFQSLTVVLILAIMGIQILNFRLKDENIGFRFAIFFWMLHAFIFYAVVFLARAGYCNPSGLLMTDWSSGLRFHGFFTLFFLELSRYYLKKLSK